jgi:hypothetical protein
MTRQEIADFDQEWELDQNEKRFAPKNLPLWDVDEGGSAPEKGFGNSAAQHPKCRNRPTHR